MNPIQIREALKDDFVGVYNFINDLEGIVCDFGSLKKVYLESISNPNYIYLIAEVDNIPIGFISCHSQKLLHHNGNSIGEIQEMYVSPQNRGLGIGKLLLMELKKVAREKKIDQLEVTSNNRRESTHRFYE